MILPFILILGWICDVKVGILITIVLFCVYVIWINRNKSQEKDATHEDQLATDENDRSDCKVCYTNKIITVFVPCGHMCACMSCANMLPSCPLCNKPIQQVVRTYTS